MGLYPNLEVGRLTENENRCSINKQLRKYRAKLFDGRSQLCRAGKKEEKRMGKGSRDYSREKGQQGGGKRGEG